MSNSKKYIFNAVFLGAGLFFGFLLGQSSALNQVAAPTSLSENGEQVFSLMIDYGNGEIETFQDISFEPQEKLFDALQKSLNEAGVNFAYEEYEGLGKLVSEIGDKKNGEDDKYWQYWVNNRSPEIGADQYVLSVGDVVEWKFLAFRHL